MKLLIGTYTRGTQSEGIYSLEFNRHTGEFGVPRLVARTDNPSWLVVDRGAESNYVIAANEFADGPGGGEISVFASSGESLNLTQQVSSRGADPCHLSVSSDRLAVANYSGGTVALYAYTDGVIGELVRQILHEQSGPLPRQSTAHPHGAYFIGEELWIPDLGADRIYRYEARTGAGLSPIPVSAGAGPRHLTRDGEYLVTELNNSVCRICAGAVQASTSSLPANWSGTSITAEIQKAGDHLYVSNRGHDSIAVLDTAPTLKLIQHQTTGGHHPRHFLIDPSANWLLVANKDSDNIVALPRLDSGLLGDPVATVDCPSPTCVISG